MAEVKKYIFLFLIFLNIYLHLNAQIEAQTSNNSNKNDFKQIIFVTDSGYLNLFLYKEFCCFFDYNKLEVDSTKPKYNFHIIANSCQPDSVYNSNQKILNSIDTLYSYFNGQITNKDDLRKKHIPDLTARILRSTDSSKIENIKKMFFYSYLLHLANIKPLPLTQKSRTIRLLLLPDNTYSMRNFECVDFNPFKDEVKVRKRTYNVNGLNYISINSDESKLLRKREFKMFREAFTDYILAMPESYFNPKIAPHSEFFMEYFDENYHRFYIDSSTIKKNDELWVNDGNPEILNFYYLVY